MATLAPIPVAPIKSNGGKALKFHHHLIKLIANLSNWIVIVKKFLKNFFLIIQLDYTTKKLYCNTNLESIYKIQ